MSFTLLYENLLINQLSMDHMVRIFFELGIVKITYKRNDFKG